MAPLEVTKKEPWKKVTIPLLEKTSKNSNIWASDIELNKLLQDREKLNKNQATEIAKITKRIKKRRRKLRNDYLEAEANTINQHAVSRDIEKLFAAARKETTTFKKPKLAACPPEKHVEFFNY